MQITPVENELKKTDRQIKQIEARWEELAASDRALVRPKLMQLREARKCLIERNLRS